MKKNTVKIVISILFFTFLSSCNDSSSSNSEDPQLIAQTDNYTYLINENELLKTAQDEERYNKIKAKFTDKRSETNSTAPQLGDVNRDGNIDIVDALLTARHYVGLVDTNFFPFYADVDGNNIIDIIDGLLIAKFYVGLIYKFPRQEGDIEKPFVESPVIDNTSMQVNPAVIETFPTTLEISLEATDTQSGVMRVQILIYSPTKIIFDDKGEIIQRDLEYNPINKKWETSITFDRPYESGKWKIYQIAVTDFANNGYVTGIPNDKEILYPISVEVESPASWFIFDEWDKRIKGLSDEGKEQKNIKIPTMIHGITVLGTMRYEQVFTGCTNIENVVIPDSFTAIEIGTFRECTNLKSVTLPETITEINGLAFYKCTSLNNITIPKNVTVIGNAFPECTSLTEITIPENVTIIADGAFEDCINLMSAKISGNSAAIGEYAFRNCHSLKDVTISTGITAIGRNAFYQCESLTDITIPEGVITIGRGAFGYCTNLTMITLPESVTTIGHVYDYNQGYNVELFENCENLKNITIKAKTPPMLYVDLYIQYYVTTPNLEKIYVPEESVEVYKTSEASMYNYWIENADLIAAIPN